MTLGEKLTKLRKENHYTQEQLAELLGVSRQSVSKWESDASYPETDKLIKIGELYDCSMDYLLKNQIDDKKQNFSVASFNLKSIYYERKSTKTFRGYPLWHINIGLGRTAKGIIAVGFFAKGILSAGILSFGALSFGLLSIGLIAFGTLAAGLVAAGSIALGLIAFGALCIGVLSVGAFSIGEISVGALAIGNYFAIGDNAKAAIAIGASECTGTLYEANFITADNRQEIIALMDQTVPFLLSWIKDIIKAFI